MPEMQSGLTPYSVKGTDDAKTYCAPDSLCDPVDNPASAALAAPGQSFPKILPLPDGFRPEGVAVGRGTTFYVGSLAGGAVYRGDLRTGEGAVFVQPQQAAATAGIYVDQRSNALFAVRYTVRQCVRF